MPVFRFEDELVFDDEIDSITWLHPEVFVLERHADLLTEGCLEKTWTEVAMHLDTRTDHRMSESAE